MIKNACVIALSLLLNACNLSKPERIKYDHLELDDNFQLNYNLAADGERYQFIVTLVDLEPYFKYQFLFTKDNRSSAVHTFTPHAMEYGFAEKIRFDNKDDTLKDHIIAGVFSRKMYRELLANDTILIVTNERIMTSVDTFYNAGFEAYTYELNGEPQTIEVMRVMQFTDKIPMSYLVLNNPKFPLIIRMDVGWVIWLKEINYVTK